MQNVLRTSFRIALVAALTLLAFLLSVFFREGSQGKGISEFALSPGLQNAFADAPTNPPPPFTFVGSAGGSSGCCGSSSGSSGSSCP